jgi:hypothetical protein
VVFLGWEMWARKITAGFVYWREPSMERKHCSHLLQVVGLEPYGFETAKSRKWCILVFRAQERKASLVTLV